MSQGKLKVVAIAGGHAPRAQPAKLKTHEHARRAHYERLWLHNPEQFSPDNSFMETERLARTQHFLKPYLDAPEQRIVDLGCGWGTLALSIAKKGAYVDALDIANNAIRRLKPDLPDTMQLHCQALPHTTLEDRAYDVVICCDVIADLDRMDRRLLVAELQRLVKPGGIIVCSTPLDFRTEAALEAFEGLLATELSIEKRLLSHHGYFLRLQKLLQSPMHYTRASQDRNYFETHLATKGKLGAWWLRLQTRAPFVHLWRGIAKLSTPIYQRVRKSRTLGRLLEGTCRTFSPNTGISHAIVIATPKPLVENPPIA